LRQWKLLLLIAVVVTCLAACVKAAMFSTQLDFIDNIAAQRLD